LSNLKKAKVVTNGKKLTQAWQIKQHRVYYILWKEQRKNLNIT
jgi:hypothetical protein